MSKQLEVVSKEERNVWALMKSELQKHNSYYVRKQYYPFHMSEWELQSKNIEESFRSQIRELNTMRHAKELKEAEQEKRMQAAQALMMLNKKRRVNRAIGEVNGSKLRRSQRLMEKNR